METILKITGMTCEACVGHVTRALQNVEGVERPVVDLSENRALVHHHDNVNISQLIEAVVEDGYNAEVA